ncbi:MAG: bifunctional riboflavin kinase/FAD synthetase [Thermodesulfobacteriota bacterium]
MTEYIGLEEIKKPLENRIVTIGNFDGVHKGHQELMRLAVEKGKKTGFKTIAVTFDPHPIKFIKPEKHPPIITLREQKTELIKKTGIDEVLTIEFSKDFANLTAIEFIEDILVKKLGTKAVVVGNDYMFGKNRKGNIDLLKEYGKKYGFEVIIPEWITLGTKRISSTLIREAVENGDLESARTMLGRDYQIRGTVVHGRNRGNKIGFPTANLDLIDELCPKMGVYAVIPEIDGQKYHGVANIGYSPTFDDHKFTVEVHFLDFTEDLYAKQIKVNFIERLRGEKKFSGIEELSEQIAKDVEKAKNIFAGI